MRLSRRSLQHVIPAALTLAALLAGCAPGSADRSRRVIAIEVTEDGFVPSVATAPRGVPMTLVVTRKTDQTCATDIVIAGMGQKWELPLGRAVSIEMPQGIRDTLRYACGMNMFQGMLIAN